MTAYSLPELTKLDYIPSGSVVALGNFDGYHYGHKQIIVSAIEKAKSLNTTCTIWTFSTLTKNNPSIPYLSSIEEKLNLLSQTGANYIIIEDFNLIKNIDDISFINKILIGKLKAKAVVCGYNFTFGHQAKGTSSSLKDLLSFKKVETVIVPPVCLNINSKEQIVSSTIIRQYISNGDLETANILLGRPFSIGGLVVNGNHLGRTIDVPTINQNFPNGHIIPKHGVYASKITIDGKIYFGVTNIGNKPTITNDTIVNSETHIFNYSGDLYGKNLRVDIYKLLRSELKFNSIDELANAIQNDIKNAKQYFNIE